MSSLANDAWMWIRPLLFWTGDHAATVDASRAIATPNTGNSVQMYTEERCTGGGRRGRQYEENGEAGLWAPGAIKTGRMGLLPFGLSHDLRISLKESSGTFRSVALCQA